MKRIERLELAPQFRDGGAERGYPSDDLIKRDDFQIDNRIVKGVELVDDPLNPA